MICEQLYLSGRRMSVEALECENCGRSIGRLESPHIYENHVVCPECEARLKLATGQAPLAVDYSGAAHTELQPVVIEKTHKAWKAMQAIGFSLFVVGIVLACIGGNTFNAPLSLLGVFVGMGGLLAYLIGRAMAWWYHG